MTQAAAPELPTRARPLRRWASPRVVTQGTPEAALLLCASNTPVECENKCCDISTTCDYLCGGQGG